MSMPTPSGRSCQLCCSTAHQPPQPAHRGWMNQPHWNSLQWYRPPGTPVGAALVLMPTIPPVATNLYLVSLRRELQLPPYIFLLLPSGTPEQRMIHTSLGCQGHAWEGHASPSAGARQDQCNPFLTFIIVRILYHIYTIA